MRAWGQEGGVPGPSIAELIPWEQGDLTSQGPQAGWNGKV